MVLDVKRFIARFVEESRDHVRRVEEGLAALDADPSDRDSIDSIFRSVHTIKGSSRMLKLLPITETAHMVEDIFGALREGRIAWSSDLGRLLQRGIDAIAAQVEQAADGRDPESPAQLLCTALAEAMAKPALETTSTPAPAPDAAELQPPQQEAAPAHKPKATPVREIHLKSSETVRVQRARLDDLIKLMSELVFGHDRLCQRLTEVRDLERMMGKTGSEAASLRSALSNAIKNEVDTQKLLMDELRGEALLMRMLPLSVVFEPVARMVRELGSAIGKDVECVVKGMEIELDRQLIDRLGDPLVHLLRNAIDHGLEDADAREKAGKPKRGCIRLEARQEGSQVVIEVADNGAGIALASVRDKAIHKRIVTEAQAALLSETEIIDLIFLPGFSTSAMITDISGRGVGMDVVKRCIVDDMQGTIRVDSHPGKGTSFTLFLPTSLAVMRVFFVASGKSVYGFTAQYVDRLFECPTSSIVTVAEREVLVIQNEFIPLVELSELLSIPESSSRSNLEKLLVVVIRVQNEALAIRVDNLVDERDMIIKPLPEHLRYVPLVAGMVMTGKGELVSVLHCPALMDKLHTAGAGANHSDMPKSSLRILVVDDSLSTREIEKSVLEMHGYQVTLAEDGLDGLQKARTTRFDAVLTDVEMPNMDGFTLTASLRDEENYRNVPIIIITSLAKEEDKRRGLLVGADAYIVKGDFDQTGLVDTLRNLLG